ncbi:MAG: TOBE domain-containing protein [Bryobacteraceae bacterium]
MQAEDKRREGASVVARVVELLPRATYRVETEHRRLVLAHAAAATRRNFVRLRPGDRVRVELSPHDPTRGRITELLEPGGTV